MELKDRKKLLQSIFKKMQKLDNKEISAHEAHAFSKKVDRFQQLQKKYEATKNKLTDEEMRSIEEEIKTLSESLGL